jgi:hypothetical protein
MVVLWWWPSILILLAAASQQHCKMLSVSTTNLLIGPDLKRLTTFSARLNADRVEQFYNWTKLFWRYAANVNELMHIKVTSDKEWNPSAFSPISAVIKFCFPQRPLLFGSKSSVYPTFVKDCKDNTHESIIFYLAFYEHDTHCDMFGE